jgi:hypothetical protein
VHKDLKIESVIAQLKEREPVMSLSEVLNDVAFRIEVLIHRRADGDNHRPRIRNLARLAGEDQCSAPEPWMTRG